MLLERVTGPLRLGLTVEDYLVNFPYIKGACTAPELWLRVLSPSPPLHLLPLPNDRLHVVEIGNFHDSSSASDFNPTATVFTPDSDTEKALVGIDKRIVRVLHSEAGSLLVSPSTCPHGISPANLPSVTILFTIPPPQSPFIPLLFSVNLFNLTSLTGHFLWSPSWCHHARGIGGWRWLLLIEGVASWGVGTCVTLITESDIAIFACHLCLDNSF